MPGNIQTTFGFEEKITDEEKRQRIFEEERWRALILKEIYEMQKKDGLYIAINRIKTTTVTGIIALGLYGLFKLSKRSPNVSVPICNLLYLIFIY